ncbi:hypothetical protein Sros01_72810 [Streptomyces roseochromogenus]|nr:hypothetical protein Sros01_72810 [Streptomyces roseochromogenus]
MRGADLLTWDLMTPGALPAALSPIPAFRPISRQSRFHCAEKTEHTHLTTSINKRHAGQPPEGLGSWPQRQTGRETGMAESPELVPDHAGWHQPTNGESALRMGPKSTRVYQTIRSWIESGK